ncbi:hypothetical protein K402DRAFT_211243 [Aulographum hederae CBS 113979]|uniref:Uncharacterized protein n=1 Tax=Aulographum hederae CBS 113979 TaxID=1176131 RepID=A0A6G1GMR9_9PEZI|nr:hypothetical protein K402DRAFT_211243 [Aulographum hederae CBS 113979]
MYWLIIIPLHYLKWAKVDHRQICICWATHFSVRDAGDIDTGSPACLVDAECVSFDCNARGHIVCRLKIVFRGEYRTDLILFPFTANSVILQRRDRRVDEI